MEYPAMLDLKKTFRMSRDTFIYLSEKVKHKLQRETVSEVPVFPEQRLAIFLYRCTRGDYYYTIAEMTGLGVSTVCCIVSDVSKAVWKSFGILKSVFFCLKRKPNSTRRLVIWKNYSNFPTVGEPLTVVIYP